MKTLFSSDDIISLSDAKKRLAQELQALPHILSTIGSVDKILRIEIRCEELDPLTWLHNQTFQSKYYWSNRDETFAMAGIGLADSIGANQISDFNQVYKTISARLSSDNPHLRYYGHFMFDIPKTKEEWCEFKPLTFILPRFEIFQDNIEQTTSLACNIAFCDISQENIKSILTELQSIDFSKTTQYRRVPQVIQRSDTPTQQQWDESITKTLENIKQKRILKVVLARRSDFSFDTDIRPFALIKHLKDRSKGCYHFCFSPKPNVAFLGASPECLIVDSKEKIHSEALAGTSTNNIELSPPESEKTFKEHSYVVHFIETQLIACGLVNIQKSSCSWISFNEFKHLQTKFSAHKTNLTTLPKLIANLHPTPAVGGLPQSDALKFIKNIEPFSRGCYAGPIGWIGYDTAELAIGIRSALINNSHLSLFAGAGIVEGSIALDEWNEIEQKISNFIDVFNKTPALSPVHAEEPKQN